jgi:hypothetical protein
MNAVLNYRIFGSFSTVTAFVTCFPSSNVFLAPSSYERERNPQIGNHVLSI